VTPQRTIEKANENYTDEMTKKRSKHFTILVSPTHRKDLAPCYFHLFLKLRKKKYLTGYHVLSDDEIKTTVKINFCQKKEVQFSCGGLAKSSKIQTLMEVCVLQRNIFFFLLVKYLFPIWKGNKV
jgi:hypothetical protein